MYINSDEQKKLSFYLGGVPRVQSFYGLPTFSRQQGRDRRRVCSDREAQKIPKEERRHHSGDLANRGQVLKELPHKYSQTRPKAKIRNLHMRSTHAIMMRSTHVIICGGAYNGSL